MAGSSRYDRPGNAVSDVPYPTPFVIPATHQHKQTLILLHGRGSNGESFAHEFVKSRSSIIVDGELASLPTIFPHMKFVFPTAKKRRVRAHKRAIINQWFDYVPTLEEADQLHEGWQVDGLRESRAFLKDLVDAEVRLVGAGNVFIGGMSQGCAMGLYMLLSYEGTGGRADPLCGFIGMSGWLPYARDIREILQMDCSGTDDIFTKSGSVKDPASPVRVVCDFIRRKIDLEPMNSEQQSLLSKTAVMMGHGSYDFVIDTAQGQDAMDCLRALGAVEVAWKQYDAGHWYKVPEQLDDIAKFLQVRLAGTPCRDVQMPTQSSPYIGYQNRMW